jgi:hypothetical protein
LKKLLRSCIFIALIFIGLQARAEFELPIFFDVHKTVRINENHPHNELLLLSHVENLTIELVMVGGNMLRKNLIEVLNRIHAKIRVVLKGRLSQVHVDQIRKIKNLEVIYLLSTKNLNSTNYNSLHAIGPVKKYIEMPPDFNAKTIRWLGGLKYYVPVFYFRGHELTPSVKKWLSKKNRRPRFVLPPGTDPASLEKLKSFSSASFELLTDNNKINPKLIQALRKFVNSEVLICVNGQLTMQDVKAFCSLPSFSLKVDLIQKNSSLLGLAGLLNQIGPPLRKKN